MNSGIVGVVEGLAALVSGLGFMFYATLIGSVLISYILVGYMIMCVGRKAGLTEDWMAYIPIARQLYQMQIAKCPWWYIFLFQGCFVNNAVLVILCIIFGALFKSMPLTLLVVILWLVASLVFTFFYYRKYYPLLGFNPNTAWLRIL